MTMLTELLFATRNQGKVREVAAMLAELYRVTSLRDHPDLPEIEETGTTFEANAALKAIGISQITHGWVLADDSGLEVDALQGMPGVLSARYAGQHGDDAANNRKLLAAMAEVPEGACGAQFRCAMALAFDGQVRFRAEGIVRGVLAHELSGNKGFGYDPLFIPEGWDQTFAVLPEDVKNRISHRGEALRRVVSWLSRNTSR
jgi:XTP/dITP diphosphohydrolase